MFPEVVEKTFGHSLVTWKIRNACLTICHENFTVRSPEFYIDVPLRTDWEMNLEFTSDFNDPVLLHLRRLHSGPSTVWVNWVVDVTDNEGKLLRNYEWKGCFAKKVEQEIDLETLQVILELSSSDDLDTFIITSHIFVKYESDDKILRNELTNIGLESLSQDLRRLLCRGNYYDVVLRIGDKDIRVHKSILVKRSDVLAKLISDSDPFKIVRLYDVDAEAVEAVIFFLYTGNIRYIIRNASIDLYNCLEVLDIEELKPYFLIDKIKITTKIISKEINFRWFISNFYRKRGTIISELFRRDDLDSTWRIHLYPYGLDGNSAMISVYAEVVSSTGFQMTCIEFSILDTYNESVNKVQSIGHVMAGVHIGTENFLPRSSLAEVLRGGVMRLVLRLRFSENDQYSKIVYEPSRCVTQIATLAPYHELCADMKTIFKGVLYKDVLLKTKTDVLLPAHKCILAARSKTFSQILAKSENNITIDMELNILKYFLQYIYTGTLENQQISDLFALYDVAEEYRIPVLKLVCTRSLKSKLDTENAIEIFVFSEKNKEEELKSASLNYIKSYRDKISPNWKYQLQGRPDLITIIEDHFAAKLDF